MKFKNRKGFTLIEALISILLLGIMSLSILSMSTYAVKYTKWNNIRLTALNLAYSQVEWLKTLKYEELGLNISGFSPNGIVEPNNYMENTNNVEIEGIKYNLTTGIYWENAISSTGEPVPQAMKKIDVTVEARDLISGKYKEYAVLGTLVSIEGEREFTQPGYVVVKVYLRSFNDKAKNVRVGIGQIQSNTYNQYTNTDRTGDALFGNLKSGQYKVEPIKWNYNTLMVMPNGVEKTNGKNQWKSSKSVSIPNWNKNISDQIIYPEEHFLIDLPGYINIIRSNETQDNINVEINPTGESYIPPDGENPENILLKTTIQNIPNIKFWRSWNYEYNINFKEEVFFLTESNSNKLWDGKFDNTNLNEESKVDLFLSFGLEDNGTFKMDLDENNKISEIFIEFTSDVIQYEKIQFKINDIPIENTLYSINKYVKNNNKKFKIEFNEVVEINNEIIELKIINTEEIMNKYGMLLSEDKSMTKLQIKE